MNAIVDFIRWLLRLAPICRCHPEQRTGGEHSYLCTYWEPECTCYEIPTSFGCPYHGRRGR